jgi:ribosomal protein S18 acetylase RimI-like enzyme
MKTLQGYQLMDDRDPALPRENYDMWNNEAYTTARLADGIPPDRLFPGVGQLFASKKFGLYVIDGGKRVAEREWENLETYIEKITRNAVAVSVNYPACAELAEKHLRAVYLYSQLVSSENTGYRKVAHFAGLAVDPAYRGTGLAHDLITLSLETLKRQGYTDVVVETTGNGSSAVMLNFRPNYRVKELEAINYKIPMPTDEDVKFRIYLIKL